MKERTKRAWVIGALWVSAVIAAEVLDTLLYFLGWLG